MSANILRRRSSPRGLRPGTYQVVRCFVRKVTVARGGVQQSFLAGGGTASGRGKINRIHVGQRTSDPARSRQRGFSFEACWRVLFSHIAYDARTPRSRQGQSNNRASSRLGHGRLRRPHRVGFHTFISEGSRGAPAILHRAERAKTRSRARALPARNMGSLSSEHEF